MPLTKFGWVDVIFVTLLIRISYIGFKNGLLPEFFRLSGLFFAFIFSFNNYTLLSAFLAKYTSWDSATLYILSFLFIFLAILFIFKLFTVASGLLSSGENVSLPNKMMGMVFGFCRGVLLISLIYVLFLNSHVKYFSRSVKERSIVSQYIAGVGPAAYEIGINLYPWKRIETPLVKLLKVKED